MMTFVFNQSGVIDDAVFNQSINKELWTILKEKEKKAILFSNTSAGMLFVRKFTHVTIILTY